MIIQIDQNQNETPITASLLNQIAGLLAAIQPVITGPA
jgi:hypothetical protein